MRGLLRSRNVCVAFTTAAIVVGSAFVAWRQAQNPSATRPQPQVSAFIVPKNLQDMLCDQDPNEIWAGYAVFTVTKNGVGFPVDPYQLPARDKKGETRHIVLFLSQLLPKEERPRDWDIMDPHCIVVNQSEPLPEVLYVSEMRGRLKKAGWSEEDLDAIIGFATAIKEGKPIKEAPAADGDQQASVPAPTPDR